MLSKFFIGGKVKIAAFSALLGFSCIFNGMSPQLEAASWGQTNEVATYENVKWSKVFCELDSLNFTAKIPNYAGASLQNGLVSLNGEVEDAGYIICSSFNPNFTPPKSQNEFLKQIQDVNTSYRVQNVDGKKLGGKYVVDLIPKKQGITAFWRFIATKDRLVQLGTDDTNGSRRLYFFDSISIK